MIKSLSGQVVFCFAILLRWRKLIIPVYEQTGQSCYPRIPHDTPGHINLYSIIFIMFLNQIRFIFIECVIKSNITIKNGKSLLTTGCH